MILTPEQEQQVQRILDIAERAACVWLATAEEAHLRNAPPVLSSDRFPYLDLPSSITDPSP